MRLNRKQFLQVTAVSLAGGVRLSAQTASPARAKKEVRGNAIKGTTDAVRTFIGSANLRQMPANVVNEGKRCLIDNVGVLLAGSTAEGSRILREYAQKSNGTKEATVLGRSPVMVSAAHAALANAGSAHALDYDDTQLSTTPDRTFGLLTHPTVSVLPPVFALCELSRRSGRDLMLAYHVGVEVECKIAEAISPRHYDDGFHTTGTC